MAAFLFAFFPQLLEIVECEIELIDREDQKQEREDDDNARLAHIIGQQSVEPQTHSPAEDGAFWGIAGNIGEKQRQPNQAQKGVFPHAPHLDFGGVGEA